jgi:hypothetical protein
VIDKIVTGAMLTFQNNELWWTSHISNSIRDNFYNFFSNLHYQLMIQANEDYMLHQYLIRWPYSIIK